MSLAQPRNKALPLVLSWVKEQSAIWTIMLTH